jgi:Holliday junction resolvase
MSKYARQKGHGFEREIAKDFRELGFTDAMTTRNARGGDWSHSDDGADLTGTLPYYVQCKRLAGYCSVNTIEEIILPEYLPYFAQSFTEKITPVPILITKANNKPTMAIIPWEDLKQLIKLAR